MGDPSREIEDTNTELLSQIMDKDVKASGGRSKYISYRTSKINEAMGVNAQSELMMPMVDS
jgi:hypothetical protein